jgi:hypothetical protein
VSKIPGQRAGARGSVVSAIADVVHVGAGGALGWSSWRSLRSDLFAATMAAARCCDQLMGANILGGVEAGALPREVQELGGGLGVRRWLVPFLPPEEEDGVGCRMGMDPSTPVLAGIGFWKERR